MNSNDNVSVAYLQQQVAALSEELGRPLKGGGGDGTSDDMMERIRALEVQADYVKTDLTTLKTNVVDLKVGLATLTERVAHLPSKSFIFTATATTLAFVAGVVTFQQQIQQFLHLK